MKNILVIGLGHFGEYIAKQFHELGHQIMAVDINEERVDAILPYVNNAQIGDSTNPDFLKTLGVDNYDVCIVGVGDDFQSSLETTSLLKEMGAKQVVARAARDVHEKFLLRNGADEVVYPERQSALWTAIRYSSEHIFDYTELTEDYAIFELSIPPAWVGKKVSELNIRTEQETKVLAFKKNQQLNMNITPDTLLPEGFNMLVLGGKKEIQRMFQA